MTLESLLKHIDPDSNYRKTGSDYRLRCPAHEDGTASLCIRQDGDKLLMNCFAGCTITAILAALSLAPADLFINDDVSIRPRKIMAVYKYHDMSGKVAYEVVRYFPKDFRQRIPHEDGSYTWKMAGTKPILYRINEVLKAAKDRPVYFVEGERDADTLWSLGLPSTTIAGGATAESGKKINTDILSPLVGCKGVYIIPDDDAPGRLHAENAASLLRALGVRVKVVSLPGYTGESKQDVSDFVQSRARIGKKPDEIAQELIEISIDAGSERIADEPIDTVSTPVAQVVSEKALLSAWIFGDSHNNLLHVLKPSDFSDENHAEIYDALCSLETEGRAINQTSVIARLAELGKLTAVGGRKAILDLRSFLTLTPADAVIDVRLASFRRSARTIMIDAISALASPTPASATGDAVFKLQCLAAPIAIPDYVSALESKMDKWAEGAVEQGLPTWSYPTLAQSVGGLDGGGLYTWGGMTSTGKTTILIQQAVHNAMNNIPCLFVSLEMTVVNIARRIIKYMTGIDVRYNPDDERAGEWVDKLRELPLVITQSLTSIDQIELMIRVLKSENRCRLAFIDYLGLIEASGRVEHRVLELGRLMKRFKNLAVSLSIDVVLAVQFNRSPAREGRRPELHDIRDSGEIEQHSDDVYILYRPDKTSTGVTIYRAKAREGQVREFKFSWDQQRHCIVPYGTA